MQVMADRDSHIYFHLSTIDPVRALLQRERHFPRQSLVSPLVKNYHAIWNKAIYSFHRSCGANYQPIPTWTGLETCNDHLWIPSHCSPSRKFWLNETIAILYWSSAYSSKRAAKCRISTVLCCFSQQNYEIEMGQEWQFTFSKRRKANL